MNSVPNQCCCNVNDTLGSLPALDVIATENLACSALLQTGAFEDKGQTPSETERIGNACVQPLTPVDRVDVGCITSQEDTARTIPGDERRGDPLLD